MRHDHAAGVTLIELLLAVAVLAILAGIAAPPLLGLLDRVRLGGAAENLYADLLLARSEAIRRNTPITVSFRGDTNRWCYALSAEGSCDCFRADACGLTATAGRGASSAGFRRLRLGSNFRQGDLRFYPARGTATPGTVWLAATDRRIEIKVSALGRVRICAHHLRGYPPCGT